jgi:hypothetical protein
MHRLSKPFNQSLVRYVNTVLIKNDYILVNTIINQDR